MEFRPRARFWAAALALVVGVSAGFILPHAEFERGAAPSRIGGSTFRDFWAGRSRADARPRQRGPALRFSPVNAAGIRKPAATSATGMVAANGGGNAAGTPGQGVTPAVAAGGAVAPQAPAASDAGAGTIAPSQTGPAFIGEFSFRMEAPLRAQLDAIVKPGEPASLQFPVAAGRMVDLVITRHEATDATHGLLYARVDDQPRAQALLAYVDEAVAGSIVTPDGEMFIVRYAGGGVHRTYQLDPDRLQAEGEPLTPSLAPAMAADQPLGSIGSGSPDAPQPIAAPPMAADGPPPIAEDVTDMRFRDGTESVIEVLIVYTAQSRIDNGGKAGMNAVINAAVAKANLAFANSLVPLVVRIMRTEEVYYPAVSGNLSTDLARLQNLSDGHMDYVSDLVRMYGPDMVSLFVPSGNAAGLAYLINPETAGDAANWTMSVVVDEYADSNISFGHELAHNLGCGHGMGWDWGVFPFAGGHRFSALSQQYRTVMGYEPGLRIPYFSNPNVTFLGVPTGEATAAYNALALNRTRRAAAALRVNNVDFTVSAVLDLNHDNRPDILARVIPNGRVERYTYNNTVALETEPFWEPATALDAAWVPMAAGDFNGDAKDDIVWRHHTTGRVIVWYMDHYIRVGTAVIWPASTPADAAWIPMASGDFNGDARPDLVWRNLTTGRVIIWYMDGVTRTGTIAIWEPATAADQAWVPLTAGDFNHDSKPDLIWRNETSGQCIIWFMDGATRTGTFALWPATNWGDPLWRPMGTGDFNHDGETDIVWRNIITGEVFLKYYVGTTLTTSAMLWGNPAPF